MNSFLIRTAALILFGIGLAGCQTTGTAALPPLPLQTQALSGAPGLPLTTAILPDTDIGLSAPAAYTAFCARMPAQCKDAPGSLARITLDDLSWQQLVRINRNVNNEIWPVDDQRQYGVNDYWTIPTNGYGDCEDYALTKKRDLMAAGFSPNALRLAVVIMEDGQKHAVLTVATDRGDFVLDNVQHEILSWDKTNYTWIERQRPDNAMAWVATAPNASAAIASLTAKPPVVANVPTADEPVASTAQPELRLASISAITPR